MAKSKDNCGSRFGALTVILLVAIIIASSSAVSKAESLGGRIKSSRVRRESDPMDRMTRFHPMEPEFMRGRPQERRIPTPQIRNPPHPGHPRIGGPSSSCTCDEGRLTLIDKQIASLLGKTDELTRQTTESRSNIASMMVNNRQLRSQMSRIMSEKQTLERETHNLQRRASSLTQDNERLKAENERLVVELLQASAADDRAEAEAVATLGSSLRELNDVVGNREAELVEMGITPQQREPEGRRGPSAGAQRWVSESRLDPDAENFASSLLAVNTEISDMTRKVEQLERRVAEQQRGALQDEMARPMFRQVPHQQGESDQVSEKIAELERLVLVALGSQPGDAARPMRPQAGAAAKGYRPFFEVGDEMGPPRAESLAIADTMSDEDLDAMANVVERVQNKSPRKCAFSVASTRVTLGTYGNPLPIHFDHVFVNKGGDFKMNQDRFVCEHAGFYFITFTVRSYDGKYLGIILMKNDEIQTAIYADSSDRNVMQSQSVIIHLESGDRLWLRIAPSGNYAVHSGVHRYTTFSGFLVYRGY